MIKKRPSKVKVRVGRKIKIIPRYLDGVQKIDPPKLVGVINTVHNKFFFGGLFKRGETVLFLHFHSNKPRELIKMVQELKTKSGLLKKHGFVGVYGDSPNSALLRLLKANFPNHVEFEPSARSSVEAKKRYAKQIAQAGYSQKYEDQTVRRLCIRF